MFPLGFEPRTSRVLGERDNHYTMETDVEIVLAEICTIISANQLWSKYTLSNNADFTLLNWAEIAALDLILLLLRSTAQAIFGAHYSGGSKTSFRGAPTPGGGGALTQYINKKFWKPYEIKEILVRRGARTGGAPRSATALVMVRKAMDRNIHHSQIDHRV